MNADLNVSSLQPDHENVSGVKPAARLFAFYLPQFHPVPENDKWWGNGFTEWTNVAKARPLYWGHIQPRLPRDLGFYDLRVPEVRQAQADLATEAGVEGFCYWHYWFGNGRRILERPFQEVLDSGKPDFPFSLAWANHSWSGIWSGSPENTLLKQEYPGREDELQHFNWALKAFEDRRYQRVDGKPVFAIFRPHGLPSSADFIDHWRELAHKNGLPGIYFVAITKRYGPGVDRYHDPVLAPFDAMTPLTPDEFTDEISWTLAAKLKRRLRTRNLGPRLAKFGAKRLKLPNRYEYADVVAHAFHDMPDGLPYLPCVQPGWDNTPRTGRNGLVFEHETPELYEEYLRKAVRKVSGRPDQHKIIFIKAWNEWAEGNYLEPDARSGHAYLDATRRVMFSSESDPTRVPVPSA